ncbi:MAG: alpha/beta hydrolase [Acidobacteria bacterium]|nr:alpha/beta hydrolase [Acidobacteriota bacterium]
MRLLLITLLAVFCLAQGQKSARELPPPDHANVRYGPHERNVFDLWLAKSAKPAPLVIYYHGGGFRQGDKNTIHRELLEKLRGAGISVAAANYRLTDSAPYPAQMLDSARALQFIRLHAGRYHIDAARIGAYGGSAGSGISQWLGFHDDLAKPSDPDPVLRQSTRLSAVGPFNAQSSYDPRFIKKLMKTDQVHEALIAFFGMRSAAEAEDPRYFPLFEAASPLHHLSAGDAPILVFYNQRNDPLPPNSTGVQHIHHPKFGFALKEKADRVGVECTVLLREDYPGGFPVDRYVEFFRGKLMR